ncbi:ribonuclease H-like domain-containing protein [Tanacetum coccineum]
MAQTSRSSRIKCALSFKVKIVTSSTKPSYKFLSPPILPNIQPNVIPSPEPLLQHVQPPPNPITPATQPISPPPNPTVTLHPNTHSSPSLTPVAPLVHTQSQAPTITPPQSFHANGSLSRNKARLVANGRSQQQGIDCDEAFSPVVKPTTIHTVLSLAVSRDWPIHQFDVKNAFLHGHLSETVYMHQSPGFVDSHHLYYGCHLQ